MNSEQKAYRKSCEEIIRTTQSILDGRLSIIEGSRKLSSLRHKVKANNDPDFLVFVAIDSETDHFPDKNTLYLWDPEVLKKQNLERDAYETSLREEAYMACQNLLKKYKIPKKRQTE